MVNDVVLGSGIRGTVNSIVRTQRLVDQTSLRLATGLRVNSALDQPQNFFAALSLNNRASDLNRLLDGIGQSVRTVQEALHGVAAIESLLNQAEAVATESRQKLVLGEADPSIYEVEFDVSPPSLHSQILGDNPDVYYRLDETAGPIVDYGTGGGVAATYTGGASPGAAALYANGPQASVEFDGANDHISVSDSNLINLSTYTARTVELTFNADTVAGRQVLYEEGAGVNGFTIYIDNGDIRVTGEDDQGGQRWFDADISAPIVAGQTYHIAFVYSAADDSFTGYLDGVNIGSVNTNGAPNFPSHSGDVHIGGTNDTAQFHDGEGGGAFYFDGRISNVAIYNAALSEPELLQHAQSLNTSTTIEYWQSDFQEVIENIDTIIEDARYRGINLLEGDNLVTRFNENGSSRLITEGIDFSYEGLGVINHDFNDLGDLDEIITSVREAREEVRRFGLSLATDLSIIQTRSDSIREQINTLESGADDLTVADQNEEGANLLATQTRQDIAFSVLSFVSTLNTSVLDLFSGAP